MKIGLFFLLSDQSQGMIRRNERRDVLSLAVVFKVQGCRAKLASAGSYTYPSEWYITAVVQNFRHFSITFSFSHCFFLDRLDRSHTYT
jgi:hypothetical protein